MSLSDEMIRASRFARDPRIAEALSNLKLDKRRFSLGIDWVAFHGVTYEPVRDGGQIALIVPMLDDSGFPDLAACSFRGHRVATRLNAGLVLGEAYVQQAIRLQGRLHLYDDPLRWTRAGRCGAVVLDWRRASFLFDGVREIACSSVSLARRVHATTRRLADPPRLVFPKQRIFGHAA